MSDLFSSDDEKTSVRIHVSYGTIEQFHDHAKVTTLATGIVGFFLYIVSVQMGVETTAVTLASFLCFVSVVLLCAAGIALFFWVAANLVIAALAAIDD